MKFVLILLGLAVIAFVVAACKTSRSGYESAPYTVLKTEGNFELREYPAMKVVETPMSGSEDGSFGRLFKFISGGNEANQKIAMTTPVFMTGESGTDTMAFVMPATLRDIPKPGDPSVKVREMKGGKFAVLRFPGSRNAKTESEALSHLTQWMAAQNLTPIPPPVYGYFDPPWTPVFLRRNEVMLRVGG